MKYPFRNRIFFRLLLYPFSLLYGLVIIIRNILFDLKIFRSHDCGIPVISIGNLTAGGTGKTPMTMFFLARLQQKYKKIAVVSRGYGRKTKGPLVVADGRGKVASANDGGDEPVMIARQFADIPVIVAENRLTGISMARELFDTRLIILDDAFQHRRVKRDVNIVLVDAATDLSRQLLLPAGDRREPLTSLARADILIFTRTGKLDIEAKIAALRPWFSGQIYFSEYVPGSLYDIAAKQMIGFDLMADKQVIAFCGIARPDSFHALLREKAINVMSMKAYADHHVYNERDIENLCHEAELNNCEYILTTVKDAVKLNAKDFMPYKLLSVEMEIMVGEEIKLLQFVEQLIDKM